ncbi:MAG: lysophospholipid acyltransferase family protein [Halieaceae bacterium]
MGIFDQNNEPFSDSELSRHIERALAVDGPRGPMFELSYPILRRLFKPQLLATANIPQEPCLFIGNHSLFAMDGMVLGPVLFHEQGRFLRGLGDKFLWHSFTEEYLLGQGAAIGHPQVCSALMEHGADLMVFPGGAHEATKTQEQRYTLQWRERYGFIRLAAKHNYPIVPMAIMGPDEFFDHAIEGRDLPDTALGQLLARMGLISDDTRRDMLPPLPLGALGLPLPKPQRCYIQFGEPVRPVQSRGRPPGKQKLRQYRDQVGGQIEAMLQELMALRDEDRNQQGWLRALLTR